jgi:hypothetical protein
MFIRLVSLVSLGLIGACAVNSSQSPAPEPMAPAPFVPSETDYWGELQIDGRVENISVTPAQEVWITTSMGRSYLAPSIDAEWGRGTLPMRVNERSGTVYGPSIRRIVFFDDSVGIAWGLGTQDRQRSMAQVLRTTDGGQSWEPTDVGEGRWPDATFTSSDGHGWIAAMAIEFRDPSRIYRSADFGRTWSLLEPLPPTSSPIEHLVMETPLMGFMAELNNGIYRTGDGGHTWEPLPTPQQQGVYEKNWRQDSFARIHDFAPFGEWLIARQDDMTYATRGDSIQWRPMSEPNVIALALDRSGSRLFVVDDSLRVHELGEDLTPVWTSSGRMAAPPVSLAVMDDRLYAIDLEQRLYAVDRSEMTATFARTVTGPRRPMTMVRWLEGDRWGSTGRDLYTSHDGATWLRLPYDTATVAGLRPRDQDEAFVWDGRGVNTIVNRRLGTTRPVHDLAGMDVLDVVDRDGVWYAYGGLRHESARRIAVARTFFAGEFRGTVDHGFVYRSEDQGETWAEVDHWPEGGVMRLFRHDNGDFILQSYTGSIRRVRHTPTGYEGENLLLAGRDNRDEVPYVEQGFALYFSDPETGFIGGWIHHVGDRFFRTENGGRTWVRIEEEDFPYRSLRPWKDSYIGVRGGRVFRLRNDQITEIADMSPYIPGENWGIRSLSEAAGGAILVHLTSDVLLLLDPATGEIEVLSRQVGVG